jgi:hypothetical protein
MSTAATPAKALSLKLYRGDAKTLLAFNLPKAQTANLAGFTIQVKPEGKPAYYIYNNLQFEDPSKHAQVPQEPAYSSVNAPIHMYRWVHVPGSMHQGLDPVWGDYIYTVTPRYFDANKSMLPLDENLSAERTIKVAPFEKGSLAIAFTRGYTQSQAFVHHFGKDALITPKVDDPFFDTSQTAGTNAKGETFTFAEEYEWMGFTAHKRIMDLLDKVVNSSNLTIDVFAYDLFQPDLAAKLLKIPKSRIRIILDNASLHKTTTKNGKTKVSHEDAFEKAFRQKNGGASAPLHRGHFGRYSHDKVFIVSDKTGPAKVLTGSTNFSVTGLYVNSNHILVFDDRKIAQKYHDVFEEAWNDNTSAAKFKKTAFAAAEGFDFPSLPGKPHITYSPHDPDGVQTILGDLVSRINKEGKKSGGSVMFAVMELDGTPKKPKAGTKPAKPASNMVYKALNEIHANEKIFSYGVSDNPKGIYLYKPGSHKGLLVTGKPTSTRLPAPFDQVRNIGGVGHQIHHKFVVCGFNSPDAVVYCGSSNLAEGGEKVNGDNLLELHGSDIATVFAIEAVSLVDHFNFLDNYATKAKKAGTTKAKKPATPSIKTSAAAAAHWYLGTDDKWTAKFYDKKDLKCADRELFA